MADTGIPDGIKCDLQGNVYSGCNDGVNVVSKIRPLLAAYHEIADHDHLSMTVESGWNTPRQDCDTGWRGQLLLHTQRRVGGVERD